MTSRKTFYIPLIVFLVTLLLGLTAARLIEQSEVAEKKELVRDIAEAEAVVLGEQLDRSLFATFALRAIINERGGAIENFNALAKEMLRLYGGITNLQLAPQAVVTQVYPLEGNEEAIGDDLLKDPKRRPGALKTIRSKKLTLTGPLNLVQGGTAVIGRLPVFLSNDDDKFWGFTIALITIKDFLAAAKLERLEDNGLNYELWRIEPGKTEKQIFGRSSQQGLEDPVTASLRVPNGEWKLSLSPKAGWASPLSAGAGVAISLFIALFAAFITDRALRGLNERQTARAKISHQAYHDELTGLPNRRYLLGCLTKAIASADRNERNLAVLFIDIDRFKNTNDTFGHKTADNSRRPRA